MAAPFRRIAAAMVLVLVSGCTQSGATYKVPLAEARHILLATGLPPYVFGTQDPDLAVQDGGAHIDWIISRNGEELFRYIAHLTEAGEGATRVEVELVGKEGPRVNSVKGFADHPEVKHMYMVAINEQIAAALEHRPFRIARVYPSLGVAPLVNMPALSASADAAAAASEKQARDNIAKAYRDEAAGRR